MFGIDIGSPAERPSRRVWHKPARRILPAAIFAGIATAVFAQEAKPPVPPLEQRVEGFVAQLEAKRKELGIVGAAVVVAHGDRILRIAGLGQRTLEAPAAVTADTVFPVASVTKQFTAVAVALAVGKGKLAFEDHPRRFVPSFRLRDPEADAKVSFIDLLAHRTGLDRSDFTFLFGSFTQDELIELAGRAVPAARLREKFLYNNTMVSLAGAAVARAYGTTYERFMSERLLAPLGMKSSTFTLAELAASPNRAIGYTGSAVNNTAAAAKPADLAAIAPAGALNSTAQDMGAWLRFLNARGQSPGVRVAPAAFARLFERHSPDVSYGLGYFLETRAGLLVAHHHGNIPGFTAIVVLVPDTALSFALLTNQDSSALAAIAKDLFWQAVVQPALPAPPTRPVPQGPAIAMERLIGHYFSSDDLTFEVRREGAGLAMILPGAPPLMLKPAGTNLYDVEGSGGFAMSVAESKAMPGRIEAALRKPPGDAGGDIPLLKKDNAWLLAARARQSGPDAALIGLYQSTDKKLTKEIAPFRSGVALVVAGEEPRPLVPDGGNRYRLEGRPATHRLHVRRAASGAVVGFTLDTPAAQQDMFAEGSAPVKDPVRGREILERAVAAAGGAEALDRLVSLRAIGRAVAAKDGLDGPYLDHVLAGKRATVFELGAFGKAVIRTRSVTSERGSYSVSHGGGRSDATGKALESARHNAVPHPLHSWKQRFAAATLVGETVVNGENVFVVELTPPNLAPTRLYISSGSYLVLREEPPFYIGDTLVPFSVSADYSDYRTVNGIRVPFATAITVPILGRIVLAYETVTFDGPIDPKEFE
jgi:CubicO group peptidase (beta-lactamase class C family)